MLAELMLCGRASAYWLFRRRDAERSPLWPRRKNMWPRVEPTADGHGSTETNARTDGIFAIFEIMRQFGLMTPLILVAVVMRYRQEFDRGIGTNFMKRVAFVFCCLAVAHFSAPETLVAQQLSELYQDFRNKRPLHPTLML